MVLHLKKLVVGVDDVDALYEINAPRVVDYHGQKAVAVWTRRKPRREEELRGGSLYRIIKGRVQCRQPILGMEIVKDDDNIPRCMIMVDAEMIMTVPVPHRPFQGWRYYEEKDVPADRGVYDPESSLEAEKNISAEMLEELRLSGLL